MPVPRRGEVWVVDLGLAAKVRPCLLLTDYPRDDELALVTVVAHTTSLRGNRWEIARARQFLKTGAFHLQELHSVPTAKLTRKLGALTEEEMEQISDHLRNRLKL